MHSRLKELAREAGLLVHNPEGVPTKLEKFAELIVQECARIARATPCPYEEDEVRQRLGHTWDMASLEAGSEIVKYFGVE